MTTPPISGLAAAHFSQQAIQAAHRAEVDAAMTVAWLLRLGLDSSALRWPVVDLAIHLRVHTPLPEPPDIPVYVMRTASRMDPQI